jgi:hypothetical protein
VWGLHQLFGHPGADRAFARVGCVVQILGEQATVGGPVHVEVLHCYELRPCVRRPLQNPRLQPGEQLGPLVVGRVEGEVDYRCPFAGLSGEGLIRGVASHDLDALGHTRPAAAVDHPDAFTLAHEFIHYRQTHGPGTENDVKLPVVAHLRFPSPAWLFAASARYGLAEANWSGRGA